MGVDLLKHLDQLPRVTNAQLESTDLIPVKAAAADDDAALPVAQLDERYVAAANGVAKPVAGVAAGYRIARGVAAVTGTATVVTGLTTVVAVVATPQSDMDGVTLAAVSATIGDQNGSPAAGSVILKCWKATSNSNPTLVAATSAENVNWIAIGT